MSDELETNETPETPPQPELDPAAAIAAVAQQFGTTPEFIEGAIRTQEENRRVDAQLRQKQRELDLKEALIRQREEQTQYAPPQSYDELDPVSRKLMERLDRIDKREEDRMRREQEAVERQTRTQEMAFEMERGYESVMRAVPRHNKVDQDQFFAAMARIYPPTSDGMLPRGITPQMAVDNTARYLGLVQNGLAPQPSYAPRDRRASITIPASPTQHQNGRDLTDIAPLDGETDEQRLDRLTRLARAQNMSLANLPEGRKFSSG